MTRIVVWAVGIDFLLPILSLSHRFKVPKRTLFVLHWGSGNKKFATYDRIILIAVSSRDPTAVAQHLPAKGNEQMRDISRITLAWIFADRRGELVLRLRHVIAASDRFHAKTSVDLLRRWKISVDRVWFSRSRWPRSRLLSVPCLRQNYLLASIASPLSPCWH